MVSHRCRFLNLLLCGLLLIGTVPDFELEHSHADGHIAHTHSGHKHLASNATAVGGSRHESHVSQTQHHHGHDDHHHHQDGSTGHESQHRHGDSDHTHRSDGLFDHSGSRDGTDKRNFGVTIEPLSRHVHSTLFGWLIGSDWSSVISTEFMNHDHVRIQITVCSAYAHESGRSQLVITAHEWFHGPPDWICPASDPPVLSSGFVKIGSPPLCDKSRLARSGVLRI